MDRFEFVRPLDLAGDHVPLPGAGVGGLESKVEPRQRVVGRFGPRRLVGGASDAEHAAHRAARSQPGVKVRTQPRQGRRRARAIDALETLENLVDSRFRQRLAQGHPEQRPAAREAREHRIEIDADVLRALIGRHRRCRPLEQRAQQGEIDPGLERGGA